MRTKLRGKFTLLFMAFALMLALPAMSLADDLRNNIDNSFDANFEVLSLQTGGASQNVNVVLQTQGSDGDNGCNIDSATEKIQVQAVSSTSAASVKWATTGTDKVDFLDCGAANSRNLTVTSGSSTGSTNVTFKITSTGATETASGSGIFTVPSTGSGTFDMNTARFTVSVTPPPNTPPSVSVTGVTNGETYEHGAVPAAGCNVVDAEDTNESATPVKDSSGLDSNGLGLEKVTCSYTDGGGVTESASATYTITDTKAPVIAAHGDVTAEATGANGALVTYTNPTADDAVYGSVDVECLPASGSQFDLGDTTVTCTATDGSGNEAIPTTFKVTVADTKAPVIAAHDNVTAEATGPDGANVSYTSPGTTDAVDGNKTANCTPASGSKFDLGDTTVTCNATDAAGNEATPTTFKVTVADTTKPELNLPDNITQEATGPNGNAVTFNATASDLVSGNVNVDCSPASGSTFPIATTTVNCSATDAAGNKATGSFTVKVQDTIAPSNIQFVGGPAADGSYFFGETPLVPTCTATDSGSGLNSAGCVVSGYSTAVGNHTLKATATDKAGNIGTKEISYTVKPYTLNGFYQPIDMNDTVNTVKNGSTVPVKFELFKGGTELTSTSAVTSILARPMSCGALSGDPEDPIETLATGGTSLRYDAPAGQFIYNWTTPKGASQVGKCYSLTMTAADSSSITAYFKLK